MPGQRGFTRRNLFRMRQFFEAYSAADTKVTALLTQLPWTHNLIILTQSKRPEEREFYLRMAAQENWKSRELHERKNWLFVGSQQAGERAAVVLSLIESAKLNGHDPWALGLLKDVFERLPTLKHRDLAQLLPHYWRPQTEIAVTAPITTPEPIAA